MTAKPKTAGGVQGLLDDLENDPAFQKANREKIKQLEEALKVYAQQQAQEPIRIEQHCADNVIRFVMLGDTQLGSLYERLDVVRAAIEVCEREGIPDLFHTGDVLDGHHVYRGQEFELHQHGWDRQSRWFQEQMPHSDKVHTRFITGNHDASFKNEAGIEVGKELSELRPDWEFLGTDIGDVLMTARDGRSLKVAMIHPGGGSAYALSYRPQKIVEQWAAGSKPDILGVGHYHKAEFMPRYRNVAAIQTGCCQDQTPFMKRQGLAAHVGFWIVTVIPSKRREDLWSRIQCEFVSMYEKTQR